MEGQCQQWASPAAWHQFLTTMQQMEWVVYAEPAGRASASAPLPGALHPPRGHHQSAAPRGVPMAQVTFRWKDYQHGNRQRTMTLETAVEFLRRFLLHVLPRGFKRMRHYGLFANGVRKVKLALCRRVLGQASLGPLDAESTNEAVTPVPPSPPYAERCPACHVGRMQVQDTWFPQHAARDVTQPRARLGHVVKTSGRALRFPVHVLLSHPDGSGASSRRWDRHRWKERTRVEEGPHLCWHAP